MQKRAVALIVFLLVASHLTFGDVTTEDIIAAVDISKLKHPYLYFCEEDKPAILDRINNDTGFHDIMQRELAEANRSLFAPVETSPPVKSRYPRYDPPYEYGRYLLDNTRTAFNLAFVHQMTGEEKYAQKAFEFIEVVCDQPTWVCGACEFPIMYDRVVPWGVPDDQVVSVTVSGLITSYSGWQPFTTGFIQRLPNASVTLSGGSPRKSHTPGTQQL